MKQKGRSIQLDAVHEQENKARMIPDSIPGSNMKIKITLIEEMLGMSPADADIYNSFIAKNAPDAPTREEEIEQLGVQAVQEKGKTIFPKMDGVPFLYDYQIKGFFKDTVGMLRRSPGTKCSGIKAYKKEIDGLLFVMERKIPIELSGEISDCQRPLRSDGPNGSIVALANSEAIPEGSSITFTLRLLRADMKKWVEECLDYGVLRGLGQWRNSGKGRFIWEEIE